MRQERELGGALVEVFQTVGAASAKALEGTRLLFWRTGPQEASVAGVERGRGGAGAGRDREASGGSLSATQGHSEQRGAQLV